MTVDELDLRGCSSYVFETADRVVGAEVVLIEVHRAVVAENVFVISAAKVIPRRPQFH